MLTIYFIGHSRLQDSGRECSTKAYVIDVAPDSLFGHADVTDNSSPLLLIKENTQCHMCKIIFFIV